MVDDQTDRAAESQSRPGARAHHCRSNQKLEAEVCFGAGRNSHAAQGNADRQNRQSTYHGASKAVSSDE
jgi:hypothetical protein